MCVGGEAVGDGVCVGGGFEERRRGRGGLSSPGGSALAQSPAGVEPNRRRPVSGGRAGGDETNRACPAGAVGDGGASAGRGASSAEAACTVIYPSVCVCVRVRACESE